MEDFATTQDIIELFRALTPEESVLAENLLPVVSNALRYEAKKVSRDLDLMIEEEPLLSDVAKAVTVDIVARTLNTSKTAEPMAQMSQSALGYTVSGTYLVPGGGSLQILKNDLKRLGLRRQRIGIVEL